MNGTLPRMEVEALDRRRRRGQLYLVIRVPVPGCGDAGVVVVGQDVTYSPGWVKPMVYWDALMGLGFVVFLIAGLRLRRGSTEFISY